MSDLSDKAIEMRRQGYKSREIAEALGIKAHTVDNMFHLAIKAGILERKKAPAKNPKPKKPKAEKPTRTTKPKPPATPPKPATKKFLDFASEAKSLCRLNQIDRLIGLGYSREESEVWVDTHGEICTLQLPPKKIMISSLH